MEVKPVHLLAVLFSISLFGLLFVATNGFTDMYYMFDHEPSFTELYGIFIGILDIALICVLAVVLKLMGFSLS
jgi:hypothetical protein